MTPRSDDVLTMREFCDALRIQYGTALRMIKKGEVKGAFKIGAGRSSRRKRWRIPVSEVQRLMKENP